MQTLPDPLFFAHTRGEILNASESLYARIALTQAGNFKTTAPIKLDGIHVGLGNEFTELELLGYGFNHGPAEASSAKFNSYCDVVDHRTCTHCQFQADATS